jgi:maltose alpha-D-glucosyltransferase/alpha-amylase
MVRVSDRWFKEAVIYSVEVDTFLDTNADGWGDIPGLVSRLDYLSRLGVTALWLNPIHATPNRDDGYDVSDYYSVAPRLGTLGDFVDLVHEADSRGIRVMIDLVVNHSSAEHPWFQSARSSDDSPYRDWYVWSKTRPSDIKQGVVFPHHQSTTWSRDRRAHAWYYHRFYDFEPDLNFANPRVREEVKRVIGFWLQLGVAGFRIDAAPFMIELTHPDDPNPTKDFALLTELHNHAAWRRGDTVMLAEANVSEGELRDYFGEGDRMTMLFNFLLNQQLFLALARGDAGPIRRGVEETPSIPSICQWATFLRNHDELDLSRLTESERKAVFNAFGPDDDMQLYDRGIRRRLAPMLAGDRRRLELAYSLQFTLPGTPVLRYGEEIGMGDDLSLPERNAIRTPMQWNAERNGGFSSAPGDDLVRPVISEGDYGFERVNVAAQRRDESSLLSWMERTLHTLRECPEFGTGAPRPVDVGDPAVFALVTDAPSGAMLALHNLSDQALRVDLGPLPEQRDAIPCDVYSDSSYPCVDPKLCGIGLNPLGYRWIRLRATPGS